MFPLQYQGIGDEKRLQYKHSVTQHMMNSRETEKEKADSLFCLLASHL